jgi:hypothetical protein
MKCPVYGPRIPEAAFYIPVLFTYTSCLLRRYRKNRQIDEQDGRSVHLTSSNCDFVSN